jgi:predicted TIM-barrel fold metal-dependent hydrolase
MIIDAHTHLFPDEVRRKRQSFCRRDEGFRVIYKDERARLASLEDLLGAMDRNGVDRSVICGFPWKDPGLCREGNDYLLECFHQQANRMIPFACLPPFSPRAAERELERCLSRGMCGIGEMAFYQQEMTPKDIRRLSSILQPLCGRRIPFLLHANEPVGHDYPGKSLKGLRPIYQLLLALSGLTIILAHWGGGFFFYELMPEVARATQKVFYDTAASPFLYRPQIYGLAVQIVGPERILFGSDYPLISPGRYFEELKHSGLPGHVQAKIKGLNAQRLFSRKSKYGASRGNPV